MSKDRKAYFKEQNRKRYAELKTAGLCTMCGKVKPTVYAIRCNLCEERHRTSARKCKPFKRPVEQFMVRTQQDATILGYV